MTRLKRCLPQVWKLSIRRNLLLLVQCIMWQLQPLNIKVLPDSLFDVKDEKYKMQTVGIIALSNAANCLEIIPM